MKTAAETSYLFIYIYIYIHISIFKIINNVLYAIYIYIYIYIGRDGSLSTLCRSCGFACRQRVLKTFPGPDYLHRQDGVVRLWHLRTEI